MNDRQQLVSPGFGPVADAFFQTVDVDGRAGAALSIWHEGQPVVDLWGGVADGRTGRPFESDTLSVVFSCTKGLATLLIAVLAERDEMPHFETTVAELWPEFAAHGKGRLTVGDVLAHGGGLSAPRKDLTLETALNSLALADELASQEPLWKPGESHQHHTVTHGALTAKLVKLATGRTAGLVFNDVIAQPLGADAWIGLPDTSSAPLSDDERDSVYWVERAGNVLGQIGPESFNQRLFHHAELPGVGGIASAWALAKIWSSAVTTTDGIRLLQPHSAENLRALRSEGPSFFVGNPSYQSWRAGVMVPSPWQPYMSPTSFGQDGAGGQVAFADSEAKIGFADVTNLMGDFERGQSVVCALTKALR
ncbi:serine hydrolase domain-containing protein [Paenarthrobacter sp. NPDC091669]|uniref:serine hydrolase domain-containing protein n=1 Tax=Paenarthrobacter sp. NPDC091669 TaxID=3364384 RepID=UPI0038253CB1